jgi:5'-nucleotidase
MKRLVAVLVFASLASAVLGQQEEPGAPQARAALTFLQINDVYATTPVDGAGGLARVATIKRRLSAGGRPVIMALAGDFLSPSVASSVFKGEQMVAALNAAGLDFATFGNHEFDFGIGRSGRSGWRNRSFSGSYRMCVDARTGKAIGNSVPYALRDVGAQSRVHVVPHVRADCASPCAEVSGSSIRCRPPRISRCSSARAPTPSSPSRT